VAGDGYTVRVAALDAGGRQAASLQGDCEQVAGLIAAGLAALVAAAGSPVVESGAQRVTRSAVGQFLNAAAGYQHAATQLAQTAARAEASATSSVRGVAFRLAG
jgi:hypothetical protein